MTQELDPKALRKVAEAATTGPWTMWNPAEGESHISIANKIAWRSVVSASEFADDEPIPHWSDALHIATFDPLTVLALLTQLEQAKQAVERAKAVVALEKRNKGIFAARAIEAEAQVSRVRAALTEVQGRGERISTMNNTGSIRSQERAARGNGYLEATRLAFRALDGEPNE